MKFHIEELLTFEDAVPSDKGHFRSRPLLHPSTERILYYLNRARYTVDIYMEKITSLVMTRQLLDLHHRGVKLLIIVDAAHAYTPDSTIKLLKEQGVNVRIATAPFIFNNYCLVDASVADAMPLLLSGTFPWSKEALLGGNDQNVFVESSLEFINVFLEEFDLLNTTGTIPY